METGYKELKRRKTVATFVASINNNLEEKKNPKNKKDSVPSSFQDKIALFNKKTTEDKKAVKNIIQIVDKSKKINNKLDDMKKEKEKIDTKRKINTEQQDSMSSKINKAKIQTNEIKMAENKKDDEIKNNPKNKIIPESKSFQNKMEIFNNPKPEEKKPKLEKKNSKITNILDMMKKEQEKADNLRKKNVENQDSMSMNTRIKEIQPNDKNLLDDYKKNNENNKKIENNQKLRNSVNIINLSIKDKTKNFLDNIKEASEIHKNKVKDITENDFGKDLEMAKRLKFEDKMHKLNRKINNCEIKEKMKIILTLKNAELKCKYETIVYDNKNKKLGESEKKAERSEIILLDNIIINYQFTKVQSLIITLKKHISDSKKYQTEKIIPLKKLFSINNNEIYEEKIDDLYGDELINIDYESFEEENDEKYIQLHFDKNIDESKESDNQNCKINYSIQKKDKILFKSDFDNDSNRNESDKLPLNLLEPECEILFYSKDKKNNSNIIIKPNEMKNGICENINLSKIENALNVKMISKEFEKESFIKLIKKGLNIDLSIAIDFTCSNGEPDSEQSLHKINGGYINPYEKVITEIYKIISLYNKKDKYDVYGFCANINDKFQKCFNINGTDDPSIIGIENIISQYKKTVMNVEFLEPTYFAPVINTIIKKMKDKKNEDLNYHILLIISDGNIYDIVETIDSIIESSKLPLSFIIIGVGDDITSDMRELNGEFGKLISSNGEILNSDIVQYVHYNDYIEYINKLSEDALRYIPDQITNYYKNKLKNENILF